MTHDVIVIGGGIVGVSIAYHLVQQGARTLLVDRGDRGRATDAAAGIISAGTYSGPSEDWARLAAASAGYYPEFLRTLNVSDEDCGYRRCGLLMVALDEEDERKFDHLLAHVERRRLPGSDVGEISVSRATELLPALANPRRVLYTAQAARVDGRLVSAMLLRAAEAAGLKVLRAGVDGLELRHGKVESARLGEERLRAEQFVIAAGAWSAPLADQLKTKVGVEPQRGQLVHLQIDDPTTDGWPIVEGFRNHYVLPSSQGRVIAGATRESGSGFATEPTAAGLAQVLDEAVRMVPALDQGMMIEIRVGLRPLSIDGMPVLGRLPAVANAWIATGHGAHGLQLGPYSGKLLAEQILGSTSDELDAFKPGSQA